MFGFSFLYPAFLAGAVTVAIPIALHLMRREAAPRIDFSAVRFLRRVPVEQTRRRRLRELLLLALRVAALLLLALAFARPFWEAGLAGAAAPITVVAVDTSFSVSAPGQFEVARALGRAAVDDTPSDHLVAVVAFSDEATVVVEPEAGRGVARDAVERLTAGFGATRYQRALARAAELIGSREGSIVVVTDLQRNGWRAADRGSVPAPVEVEVRAVPPPVGNLSVDAVRREADRLVALIRNRSPTERSGTAHLLIDGVAAGEGHFVTGAHLTGEVAFDVTLPETGTATVSVEDGEGFAADDARRMVLDVPEPPALLLIGAAGDLSSDALYLSRALAAGDGGGDAARRLELRASTGERVSSAAESSLADVAGVVLLSTTGLDRAARGRLRRYVAAGGGLLVVGSEEIDPAVVAETFEELPALAQRDGPVGTAAREGSVANVGDVGDAGLPLTLAPVDVRHPIFRSFAAFAGSLGHVRFNRRIRVGEDATRVIARFSDGSPALAEVRIGDGLVLLFASDLDNQGNDFPLHPTFVPFVHETVRYLIQERDRPREYVVADTPDGVPAEPGVALVGAPARSVAINVDVEESDFERMSVSDFEAAIHRGPASAGADRAAEAEDRETEQSYWRYGLLLMAVVLAGEAFLGRGVS